MSDDRPLRLAFADPPYLGCCQKYGHYHRKPYGCWNDVDTHAQLLDDLTTYDGWFYCMSSPSLRTLLPLAPECRVGSWSKSFAAFKPNVRIAYTWEPVLIVGAGWPGSPSGADHPPNAA